MSLRAGGLGLNLTAASYVLLLDPWWNLAVEAAVPAATAALSRPAGPACESRGPHLMPTRVDDEVKLLPFDCDWAWSVEHRPGSPEYRSGAERNFSA